jgi:hypothetical protein
MDITIIADNGGGLTLQIIAADGTRYQHKYNDPEQCACDICDALKDGHTHKWEGNEAKVEEGNSQWLSPHDEDLRNDRFRIISVSEVRCTIRRVVSAPGSSRRAASGPGSSHKYSWPNVFKLIEVLSLYYYDRYNSAALKGHTL